ncbi:MAG: carboxypeptidase-like regulatory domain-containing protein [Leadbetterella sp.]|nr:carboxypeptidase-like regulatory domain-containing protein [Leadbetterella sp.]
MSVPSGLSPYIICCLFCLFSLQVFPQTAELKGKITDTRNEPLAGVLIRVKNTDQTTVTDGKGNFSLRLAGSGELILQISLVGFQTRELSVTPGRPLALILKEQVKELRETVIYGKTETAAARELSVKAEVLDMKQVHGLPVNISELMNRSSGIRIRQTGGLGSATDINLNGFSGKSIRYFKDGIPMDYLGEGFSISSVPVNMLERVEIYKGVLPVSLGADALGGAVNLIGRKLTKNYADVSYEIGSFNTHRANLNTYFTKNKLFYGFDGFFNHSDNNYKVNVKVTDPETRNQKDAVVPLFHNAYTGYFGQAFIGLRDLPLGRRVPAGTVRLPVLNRDQQHPALMTDPYGAIVSRQASVIPGIRYKKRTGALEIDQFLVYNTLTISRTDTARGTYDWYGVFTPNPTRNGESIRPSRSAIDNNYLTSRTNLKYGLNSSNTIELNQTITQSDRQGTDPLGAKFFDTGVDVLSLPSRYLKFVTTAGINSRFSEKRLDNLLMLKFFSFKASGVETYQSREISTTEEKTTKGNSWGIAEGLKYQLTPEHLIRFSAEYANRLPDHNELFGDAVWIVQNFGIKPERSLNFNLGWRTAVRNKYTLELNSFYRRTRGLILLVPIQAPYARYENQQNVKGFGLEADGTVSLGARFTVSANATWQNMRLFGITVQQDVWKNGARLRNTPFLYGNLGVNYQSRPVFHQQTVLKAFMFYNYLH